MKVALVWLGWLKLTLLVVKAPHGAECHHCPVPQSTSPAGYWPVRTRSCPARSSNASVVVPDPNGARVAVAVGVLVVVAVGRSVDVAVVVAVGVTVAVGVAVRVAVAVGVAVGAPTSKIRSRRPSIA